MVMTNVLRVTPKGAKSEEEYVLVHTRRAKPDVFELEIDATEGSYAYTTLLRRKDLKNTRAKGFQGTTEEVEGVLLWSLLRQNPASEYEEVALSTETVVSVEPEKRLTLTIRQRIEDITPNLCILQLQCADKSIELYDWCGELAQSVSAAERDRQQLQEEVKSKEEQVSALRTQFDDLCKAKDAHENEMLEKFRRLLNSKKLKIRDQQRLLAGAKVDQTIGSKVKHARHASKSPGQVSKPRGAKRKATQVKEEDSDSSAGFEAAAPKTAHDKAPEADGDEDERMVTPQESEEEETEDDLDESTVRSPPARSPEQKGVEASVEELPPPRELPWKAKTTTPETANPPRVDSDDDDDSDEEL